tara:strand:- start:285 stop:491 length:207 start_codon:yes stop_codon:yes gene_type:complete
MTYYFVKKTPKHSQKDNIRSWSRINDYSKKHSKMTVDEMCGVIGEHKNGSARDFVLYCIRNGWLGKEN